MLDKKQNYHLRQDGFGLVEILVGLAIGLVTTLVIVQVMGTFEGQKRTTGGTADAQTNGSVALYTIQRQLQLAGYGLPIYSESAPPLHCDIATSYDHDNDPSTPGIGLFPVLITAGASAGATASITVRSGPTPMGGVPIAISNVAGNVISVANNLGCSANDVAIIARGSVCQMTKVDSVDPGNTQLTLHDGTGVLTGATLSCMGGWAETTYSISADGNLLENGAPSTAGIVNIQAQYGISAAANNNLITAWVDASGATWGATATTPAVVDRNRIKAIRIAIVARNGLYEKDVVPTTVACSSLTAANPTGICAWEGSAANPAPKIDLSIADPTNWNHYRYRVFETVVPLRNIIWSKGVL